MSKKRQNNTTRRKWGRYWSSEKGILKRFLISDFGELIAIEDNNQQKIEHYESMKVKAYTKLETKLEKDRRAKRKWTQTVLKIWNTYHG